MLVLYGVSCSVYFRFVVRFNIVCGAVLHGLWCALMMISVTSAYVGWALREKKFQKKKAKSLHLLLSLLRLSWCGLEAVSKLLLSSVVPCYNNFLDGGDFLFQVLLTAAWNSNNNFLGVPSLGSQLITMRH